MSRDDVDDVLNDAVSLAMELLEKNGEFFPFGVSKGVDGLIHHLQILEGHLKAPSDVIGELREQMRSRAQERSIVSAAVVTDCKLTEVGSGAVTDGIQIEIDDVERGAVRGVLPYRLEDGRCMPGTMNFLQAESIVFWD